PQEQLTGQFGQGSFGAYSYLIGGQYKFLTPLPRFECDNSGKKLCLRVTNGHKSFEVTFILKGGMIEIEKKPFNDEKKITIQTRKKEFRPYEMIFQSVQKQIFIQFNACEKNEPGTTFQIQSPIIKDNFTSLVASIENIFHFAFQTPIY